MLKKILRRLSPRYLSRNFLNNAFVEAIPSPVFWLDRKKVYQGCNQLFADLIGIDNTSDIIGRSDKDMPFLSTDIEDRDSIFNVILSGKAPAKIIYDCIMGENDKTVWAQKRFTPLKNGKGKIIGVLGVVVDISEQVKRRKDIEAHIKRQNILGGFLQELNTTFMAGDNFRELIEKFLGILRSETEAALVVFLNASAITSQAFVRYCSDTSLDEAALYENRELILETAKKSGKLEKDIHKIFKAIDIPVCSIFCHRMKSDDIFNYDELILLINPHSERLETASPFFALASYIIQSFYMRKFLMAQYSKTPKANY
jgi:hypothetical protein